MYNCWVKRSIDIFISLIALAITHVCVKNFYDGKKAWSAQEISHYLEAPIRLTNEILFELTEAGILVEIKKDNALVGYQPAQDVGSYTIRNVLKMLDARGVDNISMVDSKALHKISHCLAAIDKAVESSPDNLNLKDI